MVHGDWNMLWREFWGNEEFGLVNSDDGIMLSIFSRLNISYIWFKTKHFMSRMFLS